MKHIQIYDFVNWELEKFRNECNFSDEELEYFNLRAKHISHERVAELMNISVSKADTLSRKVKMKILKVI
jgi:hypothetical protein